MKEYNRKRTLTAAVLICISVLLFWIMERVTAYYWIDPVYNFKKNWISDLGIPVVTQISGYTVNSPLHALMNFTFIVYGLLVVIAYVMLKSILPKGRIARLLAISHGIGFILVGIFPGYEWSLGFMHQFGAILVIFGGNIAIILLGINIYRESRQIFAVTGIILGIAGLIATIIMFANSTSPIAGIYERGAIYPTLIWNFILGAYILVKMKIIQDRK